MTGPALPPGTAEKVTARARRKPPALCLLLQVGLLPPFPRRACERRVRHIRRQTQILCLCFGALLHPAQANEDGTIAALTGHAPSEFGLLKEHGINVGGWASMGGTYLTSNPSDHSNQPITFNDRSGEFQFNQLNLYLEKAVDRESKSWDVGGHFDIMFGTDTRFTQATGWDNKLLSARDLRFYDLAIPQTYLEVLAPFGNGITAKIGHFYTIIGEEVVTAPNNFFYSHAYAMQYGEPFTHTGALFSYAVNENVTVNAGSVAGWDNFDENFGTWNFIGGVSWTNDDATSAISWNLISGDVSDHRSSNRTLSSLVFSHSFTESLHYVLQHDFGYQQQAAPTGNNALWYGINQYLFYDLSETLSAGLRAEWFRDGDGTRVQVGNPGHYYALTAGLNWKPQSWLTLRPEVRYDWADSKSDPFIHGTQDHQLQFAADVVIVF